MQQVPIKEGTQDFIQTLQLDDGIETLPIRLRLRWSSRLGEDDLGMWVLSFYKSNGEPLITGIPLVVGLDITGRFGRDELGTGHLVCVHVDGLVEVGFNDLTNGKANIYYLTDAEYDAIT